MYTGIKNRLSRCLLCLVTAAAAKILENPTVNFFSYLLIPSISSFDSSLLYFKSLNIFSLRFINFKYSKLFIFTEGKKFLFAIGFINITFISLFLQIFTIDNILL